MKYTRDFLNDVDLSDLRKAQSSLYRAFVWENSPQGHAAWTAVIDSLQEIELLAVEATER